MTATLFIVGMSMFLGGAITNNAKQETVVNSIEVLAALTAASLIIKGITYVGLSMVIISVAFQVFSLVFTF